MVPVPAPLVPDDVPVPPPLLEALAVVPLLVVVLVVLVQWPSFATHLLLVLSQVNPTEHEALSGPPSASMGPAVP